MRLNTAAAVAALALTGSAIADLVDIRIEGTVSFNGIAEGPLTNANIGDVASLTIQVNSDDQNIFLPEFGISQIPYDESSAVFEVVTIGTFGGSPGTGTVTLDVPLGDPEFVYELNIPTVLLPSAGGFQTDVHARLQGDVADLFGPDPELLENLGTYDVSAKDFNFENDFEVTQITSEFQQVDLQISPTRIIIALAGATCLGDLDGSGDVGFADLLQLLGAWGPCESCDEDLNENGSVDFGDLLIILGSWGPCT